MSALAPARDQFDEEHGLEAEVDVGRHGAGVDGAVEAVHAVGVQQLLVASIHGPRWSEPISSSPSMRNLRFTGSSPRVAGTPWRP